MAHGLVVGQTEAGKSSLVKWLIREMLRHGRPVLILDPLYDDDFREMGDFHTDDPELFFKVAWRNKSCNLVIDEAGEMIGQHGRDLNKLATQSRHLGHSAIFITQRPALLAPTIRAQCAWLAAFSVSPDDAKLLAGDFNAPALITAAPAFGKGDYMLCRRMQPPQISNIFREINGR